MLMMIIMNENELLLSPYDARRLPPTAWTTATTASTAHPPTPPPTRPLIPTRLFLAAFFVLATHGTGLRLDAQQHPSHARASLPSVGEKGHDLSRLATSPQTLAGLTLPYRVLGLKLRWLATSLPRLVDTIVALKYH